MKPFVKYVLLKNRWKILGAGGVLGAYTFIRLLPAAVLERFINSMQGVSDAKFHLVLLAVLYLLSALSLYAAEIGKNYFSRKLAWNMTDELRVRLLARNLRMGQSFYNRYGTGEIIEHLDGDINVLESFISATMVPVLIDVLSLLFVIAIFFYTSTVLGICFIVFCAAVFTLLYLMQKTDSDSVAEERSAMTEAIPESSTELVGYIGIFVIMLCTAIGYQTGGVVGMDGGITGLTIGEFTLFVSFMGYGSLFLNLLREASFGISEGEESLERIGAYLSMDGKTAAKEITAKENTATEIPEKYAEKAEFCERGASEVSIAFREFRLTERDIPHNFVLEQGDIVAVTGPNGSGKTRLIEAILGYAPHSGEVVIRKDKNEYAAMETRDTKNGNFKSPDAESSDIKIGYVSQVTHLFHASVEENISVFAKKDSATQSVSAAAVSTADSISHTMNLDSVKRLNAVKQLDEVKELAQVKQSNPIAQAAFIANIDPSLLELREKIGTDGKELSEGQRQRVAIARAVFEHAGIVILDDPFAFLDKENRQSILERLISHSAILVIASDDINILSRVNKVIEMDRLCMNVQNVKTKK